MGLSYEVVTSLVDDFPMSGRMDCYDVDQEDAGDDPGADGMPPRNDREGPSSAGSDDEGQLALAPAAPAETLSDARAAEVR